MKQVFASNDVVIVAAACVLPGAASVDEFLENCSSKKMIRGAVSEARVKRYLLSEEKASDQDRIYSNLAVEIPRERVDEMLAENGLSEKTDSRLDAYTFECVRQLLAKVPASSRTARTDLILGCMNPDPDYQVDIVESYRGQYVEEISKTFSGNDSKLAATLSALVHKTVDEIVEGAQKNADRFFVSNTLNRVATKFGFTGERYVVDTACASSLTAIDLSIQRLKQYQSDFAISGGIESNLGHGPYIIFSKVGALATENSFPFDKRSEGLVQGEGAVMFGLKRLEDALRDDDSILGVVRSVTGGSDGRAASLFQPNVAGQTLIYKKAYGEHRRLDYIEAHGTGTAVGDQTEAESLRSFFAFNKIPVGSVKSLIGHTKGAAGAAGLLKCLNMMQTRVVPGSSYIEDSSFGGDDEAGPFVNREDHRLSDEHPLRMGINSFGFGGTNYHLCIEEFSPDANVTKVDAPKAVRMVVCAENSLDLETFERDEFLKSEFPLRLPPKSIAAIDKVQLGALLTTWKCIKQLGGEWHFLPKEKIGAISACTLGLDQSFEMIHRLAYEMMAFVAETDHKDAPFTKELRAYVEDTLKTRYAPINEDSATGILNNVIAGRICNLFDLYGRSYNIDKDTASVPVALAAIQNELNTDPDQIFIFVGVEEAKEASSCKTTRKKVTTRILTSESFAKQHELIARSELGVSYVN